MKEEKIRYNSNENINLYIWDNCEKPRGVVQIIQGVNEHGLRYKKFAHFLNKNGYVVYTHDAISQGKSRTNINDTVYFGLHGDLELVIGVETVHKRIKKDYDNLPLIAFGHSLGAGLLRKVLYRDQVEYDKVILNGTGLQKTRGMSLIILYGEFLMLRGHKKPSDFFDNIFRQTQLKLKEKVEIEHFIEWLTRDKKQNEIDKEDKYLYIRLSVAAFVDMLKLFKDINKLKNIKQTNPSTEILLMSGTHDPATDFGVGTKALFDLYTKLGIETNIKLYQEGRHDTIQEINRNDVYKDILEFIQ